MEHDVDKKLFENEDDYQALKQKMLAELEAMPADDNDDGKSQQGDNDVSILSYRSGMWGDETINMNTTKRLEELKKMNNSKYDRAALDIEMLRKVVRENNFDDVDVDDEELKKPLRNSLFKEEQLQEIRSKINTIPPVKPQPSKTEKVAGEANPVENGMNFPAQNDGGQNPKILQWESDDEDKNEELRRRENEITRQKEMTERLEKMKANEEYLKMLKEDQKSMAFEVFTHKEKFKERLYCLPPNLPVVQELPTPFAPIDPPPTFLEKETPLQAPQKLAGNNFDHKNRNPFKRFEKLLAGVLNFKVTSLTPPVSENKKPSLPPSKSMKLTEENLIKHVQPPSRLVPAKSSLNESSKKLLPVPSTSKTKPSETKEIIPNVQLTSMLVNKLGKIFFDTLLHYQNQTFQSSLKELLKKNSAVRKAIPLNDGTADNLMLNDPDNDAMEESPTRQQQENRPETSAGGNEKSIEDSIFHLNPKTTTRIEVKLENIVRVDTLRIFTRVEHVNLSMNKIISLDPLATLSNLEELYLSQNKIKDYRAVGKMPKLRVLFLDVNLIEQIIPELRECQNLEVLNMSNNKLMSIKNLAPLTNLRKLNLYRNMITNLDGLQALRMLEELDLGRNDITNIDSITSLLSLRKLILYFNKISCIPKGISNLLFLVELWLNGNEIVDVGNLNYLPTLETLSLSENLITSFDPEIIFYLPNLKILQIGSNSLESFTSLLHFIKHSPFLGRIQFLENPFVRRSPQNTLLAYCYTLMKCVPSIQDINNQTRKEIEELNNLYKISAPLKQIQRLKPVTSPVIIFDTIATLLAKELQYMKIKSRPTMNKLIDSRLVPHIDHVETNYFKASLNSLLPELLSSTSATVNKTTMLYLPFTKMRQFILYKGKLLKSYRKIMGLVLKLRVRRKRLRKKYLANLPKLIRIQAVTRGFLVRLKYRDKMGGMKTINFYKKYLKEILRIQRGYRSHLFNRRKDEKFNRIKKEIDDEIEVLPGVDLAMFENIPDFDTGIKIPEGVDLEMFINPHFAERGNMKPGGGGKNGKPAMNLNMQGLGQIDEEGDYRPKSSTSTIKLEDEEEGKSGGNPQKKKVVFGNARQDNFMSESQSSAGQKSVAEKKKAVIPTRSDAQIKEEWGFQGEMGKGLQMKLAKNRKLKAQQAERELTAAERFEKLKRMTNK